MSDSIPYLGSKISLISKSEIRYEGILYTIDAQESIIALAKVQSFGTEDRPVEIPVPAKNEIYEYIIFRGTDIKKIEVCETPKQPLSGGLHNDPAIVGLQQHAVPPQVQTTYPSASFNRQQLGPIGSMGGPYYGGYGQQLGQQNLSSTGGFSLGSTTQPSELSSGMGSSSVAGSVCIDQHSVGSGQAIPAPIGAPSQSSMSAQSRQQDVLSGSRSSTPTAARKSPVSDAGVQVSPPSPQQLEKKKPIPRNAYQENRNREQAQHQQKRGQTYNQGGESRQSYNQGGESRQTYNQGGESRQYQGQSNQYQGGQYQGQRQNQGFYHNQYQYQQYSVGRGSGASGTGGMGRGRPSRRSSQPRGRTPLFNQGNRPRQDQQIFDKEFDFEQANEEFEELRTQFAKTKISENGDQIEEKKEDSGHETATTGDESEDSGSSTAFYDKAKSFFDSISCEAIERSKGKSQRPDWRQERKINVQTFGVATARRGYYPRGRGNYYGRGGYYRNYNQGFYRGGNGVSNYRGSTRGGSSSRVGVGNVNGASGTTTSSSYASAVRSSVAAK